MSDGESDTCLEIRVLYPLSLLYVSSHWGQGYTLLTVRLLHHFSSGCGGSDSCQSWQRVVILRMPKKTVVLWCHRWTPRWHCSPSLDFSQRWQMVVAKRLNFHWEYLMAVLPYPKKTVVVWSHLWSRRWLFSSSVWILLKGGRWC